MFTSHAEYSDISPGQYESAYSWIDEAGLMGGLDTALPIRERILRAALLTGRPPWLADADLLVQAPEELPADALRAAAALGFDETHVYREVHAVWGKVDSAERERIGFAGEIALVELLATYSMARIEHVAAHSDGYGYDIAVHAGQHSLRIEAKATARRNRLSFFLSRNEFETMRLDAGWQLVIVRLNSQLAIDAVASIDSGWISRQVPLDQGSYGCWSSCRIDVPPEKAVTGIPRLAPVLIPKAPLLLTG
ncbi:protein NO VEIN domain-containing protein [Kribbella endophytica]